MLNKKQLNARVPARPHDLIIDARRNSGVKMDDVIWDALRVYIFGAKRSKAMKLRLELFKAELDKLAGPDEQHMICCN